MTTADFGYARLHGDVELYSSGYTDDAVDRWAARFRDIASGRDVHVYFDNDAKVRAPGDARVALSPSAQPVTAPPATGVWRS